MQRQRGTGGGGGRSLGAWVWGWALLGGAVWAGAGMEGKEVKLETAAGEVRYDLAGGGMVSFRIGAEGLNPLTWDAREPGPGVPAVEAEARPRGHFLCLDRWGPATKAEAANGLKGHGEAAWVDWELLEGPAAAAGGGVQVRMAADLPLARLRVEREVMLHGTAAWVTVVERVTNRNPLGRIFNLVQHPTIGPPFLDEGVRVDASGGRGFMQETRGPDPEVVEVRWPEGRKLDGTRVDVRSLTTEGAPGVVSYLVEGETGWITAANPARGLLLGYVWSARDYPWIHMWRRAVDGKPFARGLEFGTTGLHRPWPDLLRKGTIFGQPLVGFLDAGESREFAYQAFLVPIPGDFAGVAAVTPGEGELRIREVEPGGREWVVPAGPAPGK